MASRFRQEMPPEGGYASIKWARTFGKTPNGIKVFSVVGGLAVASWIGYAFEQKIKRRNFIEMNDTRVALEPLMFAEQNRAFLKQLYLNREEENRVMKDVPGWVTGTYYGEPCYHNKADRFKDVVPEEYYIHSRWADMYDRLYERRWH